MEASIIKELIKSITVFMQFHFDIVLTNTSVHEMSISLTDWLAIKQINWLLWENTKSSDEGVIII